MSQSDKRNKIKEINALNISSSEKAKLIFQLMNPSKTEEKIFSKKILHCTHYNINNYIVTKCCNKIYPCRLCHDENEDHTLDRFDIDLMKCDFCKCIQKVNSCCLNPECFKYKVDHFNYCRLCNLWSNNQSFDKKIINSYLIDNIKTAVDIYHCKDCGICRMGCQKNFKHCKKCNLCINIKIFDSHPCLINSKDQNCPVCLKEVWNSVKDSPTILKCGHTMHSSCLNQCLNSQNYFCSICKKSIIDLSDYWNYIDQYVENSNMPEEYNNWTSDIYCYDCQKKSNTKYHFAYHKCKSCQGYNTVIDKINKLP